MKNNPAGCVYLLPCPIGSETVEEVLPNEVIELAGRLRHFVVEDIKSARRFLRRMDRTFPIDDSVFHVLNKRTRPEDIREYLTIVLAGTDLAVISEAGCPGVADPGAELVALAHELGLPVRPLVGPSSILLTLMGSGMNGQEFTFHGYLPKDRKDRIKKIKDIEFNVLRTGHTHLFMDTPFRNMNILDDLLNELAETTDLCIGNNLTAKTQRIETRSIAQWRESAYDLQKNPVMFAMGKRSK